LDGSSGKDDITIWISPRIRRQNPEWNFVYSANNQAEAVDGFLSLVIIFQKTELKVPS
jgi:penicillin amidase